MARHKLDNLNKSTYLITLFLQLLCKCKIIKRQLLVTTLIDYARDNKLLVWVLWDNYIIVLFNKSLLLDMKDKQVFTPRICLEICGHSFAVKRQG